MPLWLGIQVTMWEFERRLVTDVRTRVTSHGQLQTGYSSKGRERERERKLVMTRMMGK